MQPFQNVFIVLSGIREYKNVWHILLKLSRTRSPLIIDCILKTFWKIVKLKLKIDLLHSICLFFFIFGTKLRPPD